MSEHPPGMRGSPLGVEHVPQKLPLVARNPCLHQDIPSCSKRAEPPTVLSRNMFPVITGCWLVFATHVTPTSPMLHESVPIEYAVIVPSTPSRDMSNTSPTITSGPMV